MRTPPLLTFNDTPPTHLNLVPVFFFFLPCPCSEPVSVFYLGGSLVWNRQDIFLQPTSLPPPPTFHPQTKGSMHGGRASLRLLPLLLLLLLLLSGPLFTATVVHAQQCTSDEFYNGQSCQTLSSPCAAEGALLSWQSKSKTRRGGGRQT